MRTTPRSTRICRALPRRRKPERACGKAMRSDSPANGAACATLGAAHVGLPTMLRDELLALQTPGANELARAGSAANMLAELYADAIRRALANAKVDRHQVIAVGVHGQTLRHRPERGWTLQLNNPARVAERSEIAVIADFRSRDVAAGGQGAPLVPAFHAALFGLPDRHRVIVNIGGIANLTDLPPAGTVLGFDTGPGNTLLDAWCERHTDQPFDRGGAWGARGRVIGGLLSALEQEPYFAMPPPKSTGRDRFHLGWLERHLKSSF